MGKPNRNFRGPRGQNDKEFIDKRERFLKRTRQAVMEALKSRDMLVGTVTRTMEDTDKTINLLGEKLEDWYAIYFPELKAETKLQFASITLVLDRENIDEKELAAAVGQKKAAEISEQAKRSLGVKLSARDLSECLALSRTIISLEKLRKDYEGYQKELAEELCPNLSEVAGPDIAAKLVSHMGTLARLALLPASAIQVIGAEKALFKHLKNKKVPPPKHGIIFQHARISSSPKAVRGKIARTLANKICLAAKADAFSKRRISADLKKDFDERYAQIMKEYELEKAKQKPESATGEQQQNQPQQEQYQQLRQPQHAQHQTMQHRKHNPHHQKSGHKK